MSHLSSLSMGLGPIAKENGQIVSKLGEYHEIMMYCDSVKMLQERSIVTIQRQIL